MSGELSAGDISSDDADLYNEMLRLEEMESLLEEIDFFIEEIGGTEETEASYLPTDLQLRLASLALGAPSELRFRMDLLNMALDMAEEKRPSNLP